MIKKFHHLAIVVKDLEDKIPFFCNVYNADLLGGIFFDKNQLVKVQFIQSSDIKIELLEPMNSKSPISKFLNDHGSGSFYHVAYEVDNLDLVEKEIIQKKGKVVSRSNNAWNGMEVMFAVFIEKNEYQLVEYVKI
ncbi:VOC family protein [Candidatus Pelagibacter sp.]|nr:VOC family protein [Candidatus Pelagibacter sp.]